MSQRIPPDDDVLQHFFGASLDMLCIAGFDGRFKRLNPAWSKTLGFSDEELFARPYLDFVHPDDRADTIAQAGKLSVGGSVVWFRNRYLCRDGSYRWLLWQATPDTHRELIYAIARDVTEQEGLERDLRVANSWQRALLDSANFTIISCRPDGIIQTINAGALLDLGYDAEELIGMVTPEVIHDREEVAARARVLSAELGALVEPGFETFIAKARLGQPDENEWTYIRKDGSRFPVLLSVTAVRDAGGAIIGYLGVGTNLTERKRTEADLIRSNADLEQFAYVASHDLKEPLRMVANYVQLLERRYAGSLDDEAREFIGFAVDGAKRMRRLIDDLLDYSRVGTRGKPLARTECADVLRIACENLALAIEEAGAAVTHDEPLPTVLADAPQLTQVFQNLIANALKFHGAAAPRIHVGALRENGRWILSVSDNGIGIEKKYFDRIFVIFQRLHRRGEFEGTGIGLAVCMRIIERHGGRIWVESEPGHGATFRFTLDAAEGRARRAKRSAKEPGARVTPPASASP